MSSKQGNNRDRINHLCLLAVFTAVGMIFGFIESLLPLTFIAPGIKLGLANAIALILLVIGDTKGAFSVNVARIFLSALLFGSPFSLLFSLSAGLISLSVCALLRRFDKFGVIGISVAGAVVHNVVQLGVAMAVVGFNSVYYLPVLLIGGVVSGTLIGVLSGIIAEKIKKKL